MLLKRRFLDGIANGRISLAYRRWKRPAVRAGGTLRTLIGVLAIKAVDVICDDDITDEDAHSAGYSSRDELIAELSNQRDGELYRIALHYAGADPRIDLREQANIPDDELRQLRQWMEETDARSRQGPWTKKTLEVISEHPGTRAPELATSVGLETKRFKSNVRKLKERGLTESLKVGYRLSPRGRRLLEHIKASKD